jgi:transcriptional regulator with XRE-family HTH domain
LRELREANGLTLREAASKLEKSPGYLSRIEGRGEVPSAELLCNMAALYDCDVEELLKLARTEQLHDALSQIKSKEEQALRLFRKTHRNQ